MQVRSCTLDTWLQSQVDFMDQTGNAVANSHWEGKYDGSQRPSFGPDLEAFIRRKYNGEWSQGTWPPAFSTPTPAPVPASLPEAPIPAAVDSQPGVALCPSPYLGTWPFLCLQVGAASPCCFAGMLSS